MNSNGVHRTTRQPMPDVTRRHIESLDPHGLRLHADRMAWVLAHTGRCPKGAAGHALQELVLVRDRLRQLA